MYGIIALNKVFLFFRISAFKRETSICLAGMHTVCQTEDTKLKQPNFV